MCHWHVSELHPNLWTSGSVVLVQKSIKRKSNLYLFSASINAHYSNHSETIFSYTLNIVTNKLQCYLTLSVLLNVWHMTQSHLIMCSLAFYIWQEHVKETWLPWVATPVVFSLSESTEVSIFQPLSAMQSSVTENPKSCVMQTFYGAKLLRMPRHLSRLKMLIHIIFPYILLILVLASGFKNHSSSLSSDTSLVK